MAERHPRVLAIDAGGTMTDTFIVDASGQFIVGKAQTTPEDESVGFMRSSEDALGYWSLEPSSAFPQIVSGIYSGTAMLNRLLERKGRKVGCIVSGGLEDYFKLERGIQTYLSFPYSDRLHVATHFHNEPLVPRELMRGVRERIDLFGDVAIPLYEDDVREAVAVLIDKGVDSIVINLLYSWRNPVHERRVRELIEEACAERGLNGGSPSVFLSSELYPVRRDFPRLNSTLIEAYAAEPSRAQLERVRAVTKESGAAFDLRIMAAHGGTISVEARELARTLISGPIGGVVGSRHLAEALGLPNVVCTDIGGTSFDIALITDGECQIVPTPEFGRYILNLPMIRVDSIGAGTGSFVRINPNSNRPELGPDSAGSRIGVCWPEGGLETPSVSDLNLVLGRLNPDYFLGGDLKLDVERARDAIEEQIANPLELSVEHAAAGILELFDETLQYEAAGQVLGKGYSPVDYALFCYGGGGPLHVAGYTSRIAYRDVLVPAWAAGFSAFGCACADFEYRYDRTIDLPIPPGAGADAKQAGAAAIQQAWDALRRQVADEFAKSGKAEDEVAFRCFVRMQYYGQLNDIEIYSPSQQLKDAGDVDALVAAFEDAYGKVYARSAKSPELGYLVTYAIVTGAVQVEKPALPLEPLVGPEPPAAKGTRQAWWDEEWLETPTFEQTDLQAGNVIAGPAIVESPADTLVIPPGRRARLDQHRIFHLEVEEV
jgi:N-methylhydantoinase A/oxoprolinase/acetone carboxylase beta subunit